MKLFNTGIANLLPQDGVVTYYERVMESNDAAQSFSILKDTVSWVHDEVVVFGKRYTTKRMVAWYGDDQYSYTYSSTTKTAIPWTKELLELKVLVETITGATYNSCLLNLYHDGEEGMGWHSDNEKSLVDGATIASLSLGAERKFSLKHKQTKKTVSIVLENGSLLAMKGETQNYWLHSLPKTKKVAGERINLTFRRFVV